MKENKWIIWVILLSSLFGIANNGISLIAFILSIVILTKYSLIDKKFLNNVTTNEKLNYSSKAKEIEGWKLNEEKGNEKESNKAKINSIDDELKKNINMNHSTISKVDSEETLSSDIDVYDILILHLNNKREVGKEITKHHILIEKQIDTMSHIKYLLEHNILSIKCDFTHSLDYLRVNELKSILKENKLKISGNKPELIERIKENIKEENVNLPEVYIATNTGIKLIENTKYIHHFFYEPYIVNLAVAHKLVQNNYNIDDKIEFIYLKLLENNKNDPYKLKTVIHRLTRYYKTIRKDKSIIRKFTNFGIYMTFIQNLDHLKANINYGFVEKGSLDDFRIDTESLEYYEDLILVEKMNLNALKKLFFIDVSSFTSTKKEICNDFCEILIAHINKNTSISTDELPAIRNYISTK